MTSVDFDVLIIGAGLSGIGAACHLQEKCPGKRYAILEARAAIGGTWDLFRYPGVRSDSDMYTLGYRFKPWTGEKAIADGRSILAYVREAAAENGIERNILFGHRVRHARWSSSDARWYLDVDIGGENRTFTAAFVQVCAGYYRYDKGYTPEFEGREDFRGEIVHPQHWPEELDHEGKSVIVIGSGATAMTLVPAMAGRAEHVTLLQRSPTYVISSPSEDKAANRLRKLFGDRVGYDLIRWRNLLVQLYFYSRSRAKPGKVRQWLLGRVQDELGPDFDIESHFTPRYDPWDQRLCLLPDSDLFDALRQRKASIVTDQIDRFVESGIQLKSGQVLEADIIVTATGLDLQFLGGMDVYVDGLKVIPRDHVLYRGCMISGVPNLISVFGYTNASWTLRADLTSEFMCRLINRMDSESFVEVRAIAESIGETRDFLDFTSGYVQRARDRFPRRGTKAPWLLTQNYARDIFLMRHATLNDSALRFRRAHAGQKVADRNPVAAE